MSIVRNGVDYTPETIEDTGWVDLTLNDGIETGNYGGTPQYRKIGNHVLVRGGIKCEYSGSNVSVATLPSGFRPRTNSYRFGCCSGSYVARSFVTTLGVLYLEWIRALSDGSLYNGTNNWIIINNDYFVD